MVVSLFLEKWAHNRDWQVCYHKVPKLELKRGTGVTYDNYRQAKHSLKSEGENPVLKTPTTQGPNLQKQSGKDCVFT